jgi:hypothetical protein
MRYESARRWGLAVRQALLHTTAHVAVGNLTAASTLALAFFAAMLADFKAVAELGWIAGCGVLLCALACFTVFPALMMILDRRKAIVGPLSVVRPDGSCSTTDDGLPTTDQCCKEWLPWLFGRPRWRMAVIGLGVVAAVALGGCALFIRYDHNLLHLQARDLDSVKWEHKLIERTEGASWHALSSTTSPEEALALKARYEKLPEVSLVVEVASLVPRDQPHKIEMLHDIGQRLKYLPPRGKVIPHSRPSSREVKTELACLAAA